MVTRELIILILGLMLVGVVLRGLYIAISTRRGQLKIAIDKNLPRDITLEELEMSEFPNGGARVVARSLRQVNQQNRAAARAGLNARAIEFSDAAQSGSDYDSQASEYAYEEYENEEYENDEVVNKAEYEDYQEAELDDSEYKQSIPIENSGFDDDSSRIEPGLNFDASLEDEMDNFSITAGERIGGEYASQDDMFSIDHATSDDDIVYEIEEETEAELEAESLPEVDPRDFGQTKSRPKTDLRSEQLMAAEIENLESEELEEQIYNPELEPELEYELESELESEFERITDRKPDIGSDSNSKPENVTAMPTSRNTPPSAESESGGEEAHQVLVINIMAKEGSEFRGDDLLQVLITSGLKFGDMNIFHHRLDNSNSGAVIFSVANIINPGTFDLNTMHSFSTRGISMFLALPSVINNLDAFEKMLSIAQQIRGALDGELKDDSRVVMTAQTIEHYRQRIRDFELSRLKTAHSRA